MDTDLAREPLAPTPPFYPQLKGEKRGAPGRHNVTGLRCYTVMKFGGRREEFAFSTLSAFVLQLVGTIHVDPFGLRPDWSRYTAAEA